MSELEEVQRLLQESADTKVRFKGEAGKVVQLAQAMCDAFGRGNKVLLFGNGGSAADAQHIAAELTGKFLKVRGALPVMALTTNTSEITALANDFGYETVFERLVEAHAKPGDICIGISTSGNSPNVLRAFAMAKRKGAMTVAWCGEGGKMRTEADLALCVPSKDTQRIQECHIAMGHILCGLVERRLFG
ncbi:MAG TPA: D-sedoheptulose 7-phosphate isomerase [Candidatus Thermoplasmatota archaeon]|jgi:D-sedoheptulose 7-phosphate isomerase|nr:D-sedoheptulose 7-phosphate isomerase [Candidatus Thermoplasmatota archaeon]